MATVWMTVTLLKCRRLHFLCTPYSVSISKVKNVHITVRGTLIGCILHPASAIVWPRLTTWSKIVTLIPSYMHLYVLGLFLWFASEPFHHASLPFFFFLAVDPDHFLDVHPLSECVTLLLSLVYICFPIEGS